MPLLFLLATGLGAGALLSTKLAAGISTSLIYLFGYLLGTAGLLFDEALRYTVVNFSASIFGPVEPGINIVWTALRALGNIGIIGIFVFIAISMILGLQSFGSKKLVARVLIIAVLINFSLFFTRVVIEGSNLIARQFYNAALSPTGNAGIQPNPTSQQFPTQRSLGSCELIADQHCFVEEQLIGGTVEQIPHCYQTRAQCTEARGRLALSPVTNFASAAAAFATSQGISGQFMKLTGLSSAFADGGLLTLISNTSDKGYLVLVFGIFTALLILVTALVFCYAIFLLVVRTVLFLFLLISSPLAFAVYLFPKFGAQYWSMWWNSLLRNAFFAPLLLMFLWATLTLGQALVGGLQKSSGAQGASLVHLFSSPTQGSGTVALLIFVLIIGMLYASIRFASVFSKNIAGFNIAGGIFAAPIALGLGYGLAPLLRNTLGRAAYERKFAAEEKMKNLRNSDLEPSKLQSRLAQLGRQANKADTASRREYNPMNSFGGNQFRDITGLGKGVFGGTTQTGGYAKKVEESSKKLADQFEAAARTTEEKRGMLNEAAKSIDNHEEIKEARGNVDTSQAQLANVKKTRDEEIKIHRDTARRLIEDVQKQSQSAIEDQRKLVQDAAQALSTATGPAAATARRKMDAAQAQEQSLMRSRDDVIKRASEEAEQKVRGIEATHSSSIAEAEKRHQEALKEHDETRQRVTQQVMQQAEKDLKDYDTMLEKTIQRQAPDKTIARATTKRLRTNVEDKSLKRVLAGIANDNQTPKTSTSSQPQMREIHNPAEDQKKAA